MRMRTQLSCSICSSHALIFTFAKMTLFVLVLGYTLLLSCISPGVCSGCVQYSSDEQTALQCSLSLVPCSYVRPYGNLTQDEAENQLEAVFSRVAKLSSPTQKCFEAFKIIYCHQVYTYCGSSLTTAPGYLCANECASVTAECESSWPLDSLVDKTLDLPPFAYNCSADDGEMNNECISLKARNSTEDQNCKDSSSSNSVTYLIPTIIGLIVGIALITILLLWIAFKLCHCSSRSRADQKPDAEEASHCTDPIQPGYANQLSQNYHQNTLLMRPRAAFISLDSTAPTGTFPRNLKTKNFLKMSPKQRIQALEFPHERICIMKDQEGSSFGPTYIGEATGLHENEPTTTVFIKSLRNGATEDIKRQFNAEMIWVSSYSHQNVLPLLAICNKEEPHYMVYEYLEFGTLKHFLCNLDSVWMDFDDFLNEESSMAPSTTTASALGMDDLIHMGIQVANGMDYLTSKGLVHKDLATRNCHVGPRFIVKIANFGLNYMPHSRDYCIVSSCSKSTPVPLRWLAPESLEYGKFSGYSDVWSFGVLLWEIFSFGIHPYADSSNAQVVKNILQRNLLVVPEAVPHLVCDLIYKCWHKTPVKRPPFSTASRELENALGCLEGFDLKKFGTMHSSTSKDQEKSQ